MTANGQTMVYGGGVPALTTTVSGLVAGQTLATSGISGQAACATTATGASGVGAYPITCSVGTLSSSDYAFTFAPGTLTISQATTTTSVNVSASTVTVSVAPQFSGSPPGTVAVSLGGTSASCTLAPQANGPSNCSVPVPTSLAAGTYPVTASYGASADFAGSSGTGQLVVAASSTGSSPAEVQEGALLATPGRPGAAGPRGLQVARRRPRAAEPGAPMGSPGPTRPPSSCWPSTQPRWRSGADGPAGPARGGADPAAMNAFLKALHNLKDRIVVGRRLGGRQVGLDPRSGGRSRRSFGILQWWSLRWFGVRWWNGTGNGSSSNPTTVNLVASQSKPASPAMTALLLGLLVLALVVMAMAAIRRNALRARALVTSAGDDEGEE